MISRRENIVARFDLPDGTLDGGGRHSCCVHCAEDKPHIAADTHATYCEPCRYDLLIAAAKAEAWNEGFEVGCQRHGDTGMPYPLNPYRKENS